MGFIGSRGKKSELDSLLSDLNAGDNPPAAATDAVSASGECFFSYQVEINQIENGNMATSYSIRVLWIGNLFIIFSKGSS